MRAAIIAREGPGAERKYLPFKPLWQRALIVLAGPAANFLLAIVLFSIFFGLFGQPMTSRRIDQVVAGSAAAQAGFQSGDVLLSADGQPVNSFEDLQFYVQYRAGVPIDFRVARAGRTLDLIARPGSVNVKSPFGGDQSIGMLGLTAKGGRLQRFGRPARGNPGEFSQGGRRTAAERMRKNKESGAIVGELDRAREGPTCGRLGPHPSSLIESPQDPQTEECPRR